MVKYLTDKLLSCQNVLNTIKIVSLKKNGTPSSFGKLPALQWGEGSSSACVSRGCNAVLESQREDPGWKRLRHDSLGYLLVINRDEEMPSCGVCLLSGASEALGPG